MRRESAPDTATSMRPRMPCGQAMAGERDQLTPPSVERYRPLPGPPLEKFHGWRSACHSAAYTILESCGSNVTSMAPVRSSFASTFVQVLPPSAVRKTPRSAFGPKAWPSAATRTMSGFLGSTIRAPIWRVSRKPQTLPALAAVERLEDTVPVGHVTARTRLARAHIEDVGIGGRHGQRADGGDRRVIRQHGPGCAAVGGLPDSARHGAEIIDIRLAGYARHREHAAAAIRTDAAPVQGPRSGSDRPPLPLRRPVPARD